MASKNAVAVKSVEPIEGQGIVGKGVTVSFEKRDGKHYGIIVFELDTVRIKGGDSGVNKRSGERWERIHDLVAKVGAAFGRGKAWFQTPYFDKPIGIGLDVVIQGDVEKMQAARPAVRW